MRWHSAQAENIDTGQSADADRTDDIGLGAEPFHASGAAGFETHDRQRKPAETEIAVRRHLPDQGRGEERAGGGGDIADESVFRIGVAADTHHLRRDQPGQQRRDSQGQPGMRLRIDGVDRQQ